MGRHHGYPRGHDFSASVIKTLRMCKKRLWYKKVKKFKDPPGPQARVGSLVHEVLELAALTRLEPDRFPDIPQPESGIAEADELITLLHREAEDQGVWAFQAASESLKAAAPIDFSTMVKAEYVIEKHPIGPYTMGGVLDRIDAWHVDGVYHVVLSDYKTGFVPPADELHDDPQTVLYLKWAADTFEDADELALCFWWPGAGHQFTIRYDPEAAEYGLARILREWAEWVEGGYTEAKAPEANLGVHCSHCPYRAHCDEYQVFVKTPARVHPWEDKSLPELVELRHQMAGDAKMLETARKEIDLHVIERLGGEERWEDDGFRLKVQRDRMTNYPVSIIPALAKSLGLPVADVAKAVCAVSTTKVRALARTSDQAAKVAKAYETAAMKRPYLRVRTKGGMF